MHELITVNTMGKSKLNVLYRERLGKDLQPCEGLIKFSRLCNFVSLYQLHVVVKQDLVICKKIFEVKHLRCEFILQYRIDKCSQTQLYIFIYLK